MKIDTDHLFAGNGNLLLLAERFESYAHNQKGWAEAGRAMGLTPEDAARAFKRSLAAEDVARAIRRLVEAKT